MHRSLLPVLKKLEKEEGYAIVGLEQTSNSVSMYDFKWPHKVVLVVGHGMFIEMIHRYVTITPVYRAEGIIR